MRRTGVNNLSRALADSPSRVEETAFSSCLFQTGLYYVNNIVADRVEHEVAHGV